MKDRSVQYPKRYRLTKIPGTDDIYDLDPAPGEITEEGTLINKGTLLSDDTAASLDLGADAVPDDALKALIPKVGDIRVTARTDLNNTWLLCNGDKISSADYPELSSLLSNFFEYKYWKVKEFSNSTYSNHTMTFFGYVNGYWIACERYFASIANTYIARMHYTADINGTWATKDFITQDGTNGSADITSVTYAHGYWVVGVKNYLVGTTCYGAIFYSTTIDGAWTVKYPSNLSSTGNGSAYINSVTYANGYWVLCGGYMSGGYWRHGVWYSTSLTGTFIEKNIVSSAAGGSGAYEQMNSIAYADGYWLVGSEHGFNSNYGYPCTYHATSLGDTWNRTLLTSSYGVIYRNRVDCVMYINGYWIVTGCYSDTNGTTHAFIGYGTAPDSLTIKRLFEIANDNQKTSVTYGDGLYMVCGQYYDTTIPNATTYNTTIAYAKNLDGLWSTLNLYSSRSSSTLTAGVGYADGNIAVGANVYDPPTRNVVLYTDGAKLPTISNALYTYIKAKEG